MAASRQPARPRRLPRLDALLADPPGPDDDTLMAHELLEDAIRLRASDIHIDPSPAQWRIRLRIDGRVVHGLALEAGEGRQLVNQFKVLSGLDPMPSHVAHAGSFSWPSGEHEDAALSLRVTAVNCVSGEKLAIRFLSPPKTFEDIRALGIGEQGALGIRLWMDATGGMLLVAGPTGAGKTTTLYTLLNQLRLTDSHVVTLEDPVEYPISGINQIEVDAERGLDFATGTRSMLRLDPDYVLIGEIRDPASAAAAVSVASSGRSLMGTLHSRDAVGAVSALRHMGLEDAEISATLGLVIAQRLVRCLCRHCRERQPTPEEDVRWLEAVGLEVPEHAWVPVGCEHCDGLGYRERTGVFEVWQPTPEDHALLMRHVDDAVLRRQLLARGETLMFADGLAKAAEGVTTLREVLRMGAILPA